MKVFFPAGEPVDTALASLLAKSVRDNKDLPGLSPGILDGNTIIVSLAAVMGTGVEGRTDPARLLIVLPHAQVKAWGVPRLDRVMRHELAHLTLGRFIPYVDLPAWFEEGFAEWVAGGLTCRGGVRIALELLLMQRSGRPGHRLADLSDGRGSQKLYDYSASFFAYLEEGWAEALESGRLLGSVRRLGLEPGLQDATGSKLEELEERWWAHLLDRYLPNGLDQVDACPVT